MTEISGRIQAFESCGSVDGPGLRCVVFLQGCPLRCRYCHNPDSWEQNTGKIMSVTEVMHEILKYRHFMRFSRGGITLSGGEPLLQSDFSAALLRQCRENHIHTVLDTAGSVPLSLAAPVLDQADLVLLDIKSIDPDNYRDLTGGDLSHTMAIAAYLGRKNIPVWLRYVLVPGLTDRLEQLERLGLYASTMPTLERVEILPFHQIGAYKWQELHLPYDLADCLEPSAENIETARRVFTGYGLRVVV